MPKVAEQGLQAKLQKLSGSQPSIESVTEYCLFYYEDAQRVVAIWQQELQKARPERKLALVWVANHILLTAHRAKGQAALQAYQAAFSHAMPKAVTHCMQQGDEKLLKGVTRTVNVWEERKVFSSKHIKQLKDIVSGAGAAGPAAAAAGGGGLPSTSSRGANGTAPSSSTAQLQQLGPVGEWLTSVHRNTQTTSEEQQKFSGSFTPVSATCSGPRGNSRCVNHVLLALCQYGLSGMSPSGVEARSRQQQQGCGVEPGRQLQHTATLGSAPCAFQHNAPSLTHQHSHIHDILTLGATQPPHPLMPAGPPDVWQVARRVCRQHAPACPHRRPSRGEGRPCRPGGRHAVGDCGAGGACKSA